MSFPSSSAEPAPASAQRPTATILLLLVTACWGVSFPLVHALSLAQQQSVPGVGTWCLTSWGLVLRFALAAVVIGWWCRRELTRPTAAEWQQGLGLGLFTAGGMLLQMDGLSYTEASTSAFLTQCYAVWIPLLAACRNRLLPELRVILSVLTVLAGVAILSGLDPRHLTIGRGELETIGCSVVYTVQILLAERPGYSANRMGLVTVLSFVVATLAFLPVVVVSAPSVDVLWRLYADPRYLLILAVLAIVSTGIGMLIMFRWQRHVGATAAAIIYCTEPVFATLFAFVLPGLLAPWLGIAYANEGFTNTLLLGGGLIFAANVAMQWRRQVPTG